MRELPERGRWTIDVEDSWHWSAVEPLSQKVMKAAMKTREQCANMQLALDQELEQLAARKKILLDPDPITEYTHKPVDGPRFSKMFDRDDNGQVHEGKV